MSVGSSRFRRSRALRNEPPHIRKARKIAAEIHDEQQLAAFMRIVEPEHREDMLALIEPFLKFQRAEETEAKAEETQTAPGDQ